MLKPSSDSYFPVISLMAATRETVLLVHPWHFREKRDALFKAFSFGERMKGCSSYCALRADDVLIADAVKSMKFDSDMVLVFSDGSIKHVIDDYRWSPEDPAAPSLSAFVRSMDVNAPNFFPPRTQRRSANREAPADQGKGNRVSVLAMETIDAGMLAGIAANAELFRIREAADKLLGSGVSLPDALLPAVDQAALQERTQAMIVARDVLQRETQEASEGARHAAPNRKRRP